MDDDFGHVCEPTASRGHARTSVLRPRRALPTVADVARPLTSADVLIALVVVAAVVLLFTHGHAHRTNAILADPRRTPGVLNPNVTQANIRSTICSRGWTSTIRPPVSYTTRSR